ncbi:hypothetical protein AJ80_01628 [Polytolypa hystricis UAMH7299]|uniref:Uncharacterized protein n=1 Tax=Polytolypa hystricis (strain UAMH7299) TaxID=1447883 RepID=A0A2B7Z0S4_POLH7|nr:hypothetical protein AJ80_01628 [Polytolypa hystricis UAMH7299]
MTASPPAPLPWAHADRGLLDSRGITIRKCSTEFLTALYAAYMDAIGGDDTHVGIARSYAVLGVALDELLRLVLHPSLFPSGDIGLRFQGLLMSGTKHQFDMAEGKKDRLIKDSFQMRANDLAREEDRILEALNRPTYDPNLMPWEQFLLKGSPGSGVHLPETAPNEILRVMPIGGAALYLRWLRNHHEVKKKCEEAEVPENILRSRSAVEQGPYDPTSAVPLPSSGLRHYGGWIQTTPNPYFERYFRSARDNNAVEKLETLSKFLDFLVGEQYADFSGEEAGINAMYFRTINDKMDVDGDHEM